MHTMTPLKCWMPAHRAWLVGAKRDDGVVAALLVNEEEHPGGMDADVCHDITVRAMALLTGAS